MKYIGFLLFMIFSSYHVDGQVTINESVDVARVMAIYQMKASENGYIDGWKIQVINTDDRRKMEAARSKFAAMYPDIPIIWKHIQPYYQVQAGSYQTRLELEPLLRSLSEEFPKAIPVRAKILKSDLAQ